MIIAWVDHTEWQSAAANCADILVTDADPVTALQIHPGLTVAVRRTSTGWRMAVRDGSVLDIPAEAALLTCLSRVYEAWWRLAACPRSAADPGTPGSTAPGEPPPR